MMDNPSPNPASALVNDESSRVKFLCSFSGSILPRPQDGKLRYVGGETRIVSVPRNITYEELMARMRELYEGASILKYQQPDEDLDALVSVVNDDDVTNMMEEYDKLGSGDGFTRLRIFLFSHPDQDVSPHYVDGDETERRYVDALNSLNELPDYRRQQQSDSPVMTPADEIHIADQFFNSINLDGSQHNQRNYEIPMSQYNLRHLAVPAIGSPQHSSPVAPRYNDELPWSPAYYSPRFAGRHDTRTVPDFPSSPSSARYLLPFQDVSDKCMDRMPEECMHQHVNHQPIFDQQQQCAENMLWVPTGGMPAEKGGFPGNILHAANVFDGSSVCEQCRIPFQRNQSTTDFQRKLEEQSHLDQVNVANGHLQVGGPCVDCGQDREALIPNSDPKLQYVVYDKEQSGPRSVYGETQCPDRSWVLQHQLNPRREELRDHISGAGRISDRYVLDSNGMNIPLAQGNLSNGQLMPSSFVCHGDPRHVQTGTELGNEVVHSQTVSGGPQIHVPLEERVVHPAYSPSAYGTDPAYSPSAYGTDIPHQMLYGHPSAHALWRNVPTHVHIPPTYDTSSFQQRNGTASPMLPRGTVEGSPRVCAGGDQNPWVDSSHKQCGFDGSMIQENAYAHAPKLNSGPHFQENRQIYAQDHGPTAINLLDATSLMDPMKSSDRTSNAIDDNLGSAGRRVYNPGPRNCNGSAGVTSLDERIVHGKGNESVQFRALEGVNVKNIHLPEQNDNGCTNSVVALGHPVNSNMMPCDARMDCAQMVENTFHGPAENTDLSFLPDLIASAKKAKLENAEVVKARVREDGKSDMLHNSPAKDANPDETESVDGHENSACGSDNANFASKIEPTKAEEEAIARGLQTIKNDDLEEVRELGSGTYGAVYHGKWKGSDVAIKRIKASCFAGRPSERERLIADFWKEALILSSLHHPNVVSFYGIVRDGPDGSLATVTEFMVNGSLKQYLQKKDRTIDRRKRLIIAMDAAFGMEYLHGKNIVHFDLKCENLLVNMRDPHRPVCKIGDLGLSKVKQHTLVSGGVRGTLPWMAPELLSGKSTMVTEKVDVYSFGIVMWELLTGEEPYKDVRCASIIGGIVNNMLRPEIPTWCDPEWKSLMESCWASDPAARPSFSEISQKLRSMAAAMNVK